MAVTKSTDYVRGFEEGWDAVRAKPLYAPTNPYDDEFETDLYDGWEAGADSAGISDIYTNGLLNKSERR